MRSAPSRAVTASLSTSSGSAAHRLSMNSWLCSCGSIVMFRSIVGAPVLPELNSRIQFHSTASASSGVPSLNSMPSRSVIVSVRPSSDHS